MIRSLYYIPGKAIRKDIPPKEFPELKQDQQGLLWVDFVSEPPEICLPILQGFGFHPLAIDDALQESHVPRLDDWGDYLYIVLNYMNAQESGDAWETEVDELDIFLGKNYIVTHHDYPVSAVDETWAACDRDERNVQEEPIISSIRLLTISSLDICPPLKKLIVASTSSRIKSLTDHRLGLWRSYLH